MQQRIIWFILFLFGLAMIFYVMVIDDKRSSTMVDLEEKDYVQDGDVKSTLEVYRRLELKWEGTSQHVKTLQEDLISQIDRYETKMDSIGDDFMRVRNSINNTKEHLLKKIDALREELESLNDQFKAYKRGTNRKLDDIIITKLPRIEDDLQGITDSLDVILSLESIKKEIKKKKNSQ
jgi:molecular chaperone GrpE (heat shock protein)